MNNHIILMGFKHTGKTSVGKRLAEKINWPFIDLDQKIEEAYLTKYHESLRCRDVMLKKGEEFFRLLENGVLQTILYHPCAVIALGGGTPLKIENQRLLTSLSSQKIHITAPERIVFERILLNGLPAYFPLEKDPYSIFLSLWKKHLPIYETLSHQTVCNDKTIDETVKKLLKVIQQ